MIYRDDIANLLHDLKAKNHFQVCKALKEIANSQINAPEIISALSQTLKSTTIAVERQTLNTIIALGVKADDLFDFILKRFIERLDDAGCDFSCCGFGAYHGPMDLYVSALLALSGAKTFGELKNSKLNSGNITIPDITEEMINAL